MPEPAAPLLPALAKLQSSVSHAVSDHPTQRFQHTLEALIDFTGYLTTKTYALASAMHRLPGTTPPSGMPIEEEEVRMEIKALKGLVLNRWVKKRTVVYVPMQTTVVFHRRTFMPTIPRPSSAPIDKARVETTDDLKNV